jgi:nickel-dependent lactate racemase
LINNHREVVGVFAGDFVAEHRAGVKRARELYATPTPRECDIVVTNSCPIENQAGKSLWPAKVCLKKGGIAVVVAQSVEGQAIHSF